MVSQVQQGEHMQRKCSATQKPLFSFAFPLQRQSITVAEWGKKLHYFFVWANYRGCVIVLYLFCPHPHLYRFLRGSHKFYRIHYSEASATFAGFGFCVALFTSIQGLSPSPVLRRTQGHGSGSPSCRRDWWREESSPRELTSCIIILYNPVLLSLLFCKHCMISFEWKHCTLSYDI